MALCHFDFSSKNIHHWPPGEIDAVLRRDVDELRLIFQMPPLVAKLTTMNARRLHHLLTVDEEVVGSNIHLT